MLPDLHSGYLSCLSPIDDFNKMINVADVLFCVGVGCTLAGAWWSGRPDGLMATGVLVCIVAVFVRRTQRKKK